MANGVQGRIDFRVFPGGSRYRPISGCVEDGIVDYHAFDVGVGVGFADFVFEGFAKAVKAWWMVEGLDARSHFLEESFGDGSGLYDFA
ncbi:hypothetical protein AC579_9226 [Pseudocercospora musae]|uniref:Uncharacterized protein n=1 Tax=Pseudocercospora musae TaxID=113226 RepID=A0A139IB53_9PEZI|nr:hypothetical protein AC579_9226 [Pseudocercospora musae]